MTITVDIPSLQDRALSQEGLAVLETLAEIERNLGTPTARAAIRRSGATGVKDPYNRVYALENAGLVRIEQTDQQKGMKAWLTDAGWQLVGRKPIWLES